VVGLSRSATTEPNWLESHISASSQKIREKLLSIFYLDK